MKVRLLKDVPDMGLRGQVISTVPSLYRVLLKRGWGEDALAKPKRPAENAPVIDIEVELTELPDEVDERAAIIMAIEAIDPEFNARNMGVKKLRKHLERISG